ncbi:MAG: hypothetical protein ACLPPF_18600 [Rhodomicrobium sp.]
MAIIPANGLASNVGLLDARATGRKFYCLRQSFLPVDFFDMCSIIEEICLREKIVLVGKWRLIPSDFKAAIQPFVDERVFQLVLEPTILKKMVAPDAMIMSAASAANKKSLTSATTEDANLEVARLLGAEVSFKVPALPLLGHLQHFGQMRRPVIDHLVCDLAAQYQDVRELAEDAIWRHSQRNGLRHVSIPPIALEIIRRCSSIDQVVTRTLEMREEFWALRQKMTELADILADPSLSVEKYLSLTQDWKGRWEQLSASALQCNMSYGLSDFTLLANGYELSSAIESHNYVGAIMSGVRILNQGRQYLRHQLFRPIRTPVRNYLRTTRTEMCAAVSKIFDIAPQNAEYSMGLVASSDDNIWKKVCENIRPSNNNARQSTPRLSA